MNEIPARNIAQIVATHKLAEARRRAGKPVWDRKVRIKGLLGKGTDNATVTQAAHNIARRLKKDLPATWLDPDSSTYDWELDDLLESFESFRADNADENVLCGEFNHYLSNFYDWADAKRVWVE